MIRLTLAQVADVVGGTPLAGVGAAAAVDDVVIDSRRARAGSLFVPLPGEHVDGHDFVGDALARGAAGFLVAAERADRWVAAPGVAVDDPGDALLGLGAWVRATVAPTVVAVTGSSGKTTTKDLIGAAAGAQRRVVANPGSYNNELGVPLTCCLLTGDTEVLVAEVGARGVGHISSLAWVLDPDVAVVTAVSAAHLETFGDVDTVARAKRELLDALGRHGVAVLNADDPRVAAMAQGSPADVVTYSRHDPAATWHARDVRLDGRARASFAAVGPGGVDVAVRLPVPGGHNVGNALAALAVAHRCGVDPAAAAAALETARVSSWRMQLAETAGGVVVLNDAYNANPASTAAALETLAAMATDGRRWAVLGQMAELGGGSGQAHAGVGRLAARLGVDGIVVVGREAAAIGEAVDPGSPTRVVPAQDADAALAAVRERLGPGDVVLVKGSRVAGLERVAAALLDAGGGA
ncbi:UDP-N-acetylmuramoyl-tripeptide--D-alanyl-D-alanine ligase [soil metagenome]